MTEPVPVPRSQALFDRACKVMPGGVSSPVRAFRAVGGTPRFVAHAAGARFTDADGRSYLDFVMSWGPLLLGHAHPAITQAIAAAAARGASYGAPHEGEVELAELVVQGYPGLERVRFTSSGTEATQSAIRLARGCTGRDRILKFAGCYHGHADGLLVAAGSGAATFGTPSSAGVPAAVAALTSVLPLDDDAALRAWFARHGAETAAVIIEPVPANEGLLLQRPGFLRLLRELCTAHGALLIFDEVISGFRVARGG
ncbi:MAG: aminotransferase class III-fold pyridoxal phosphate-dependent enzyme, partial [Planctomycetes bacterium]|nr:aminotransferase class III-fold pyridoxal phosphate-dependent enzyme [Planctomycetota bacterium]